MSDQNSGKYQPGTSVYVSATKSYTITLPASDDDTPFDQDTFDLSEYEGDITVSFDEDREDLFVQYRLKNLESGDVLFVHKDYSTVYQMAFQKSLVEYSYILGYDVLKHPYTIEKQVFDKSTIERPGKHHINNRENRGNRGTR